jgi:Tyrosine phosphatase family
MIQTLEIIKSEYGDAEGYVKKVCGLTDEGIQKIRDRLIVKGEKDRGRGWTWEHVSRL